MDDRKAVETIPDGTKIARTAIVLRWRSKPLGWSEAGEAAATVILRAIGAAAGFGEPHGKVRAENWDFGMVAGYALTWLTTLSQDEISATRVMWNGETPVGFVDETMLLRGREVHIDIETLTPVVLPFELATRPAVATERQEVIHG